MSTVAGTGSGGFAGDGGQSTSAQMNSPYSISVASDNTIYVADTSNNRIRMILPNGIISTVGGTGGDGYNSDNIQAVTATLYSPRGVFVTSDNAIYVADYGNDRIRMILPNGIISTVASAGTPSGVFVTNDKTIYITSQNACVIKKVSPTGIVSNVAGAGCGYNSDGIQATSAQLSYPQNVFVTSDNTIYIADQDNHRIRAVSPIGIITTVAGTGTAGYNNDNIPATSAQINTPYSVFVTLDNMIYIADKGNNRIRVIQGNELFCYI
jgi:serine/threonine-protein kinase